MQALIDQGVCVLPLPPHLHDLHTLVPLILADVKEVVDPAQAVIDLAFPISAAHPAQFVLGGYGATGLPSLTHHPLIRRIRQDVYAALLPLFAQAYPGRRLEVLFDRFSIRRVGTKTSPETWHRDVRVAEPNDLILGGWLNLDATLNQQFSCLPGDVLATDLLLLQQQQQQQPTTKALAKALSGFAKFSKAQQATCEATFQQVGSLVVPPAHIILFNQTIAHKITGATAQSTSYRLYFGWRLTDSRVPLYDKDSLMRYQRMPELPSGPIAPMYALLHWVNWASRLKEFSTRFKPEFCEPPTSVRAGCVLRAAPGLVETGHAFPAYTSAEQAMFYPTLLLAPEASAPDAKRRKVAHL